MLCYHSSRRTADVMHDTIYWLSINRVIFRAMALPIVLLVTGLLYYLYMEYGAGDAGINILDLISSPIKSSKTVYIEGFSADLYYAFLTFITSLMIVPLLYRYFVDRKSLLRINMGQMADALVHHFWHTLLVALVAAIGAYLMCSLNWFLMIVVGLVMELVLPYLMMVGQKPQLKSADWFGRLWSGLYILLVCYITIIFPSLSAELVVLVFDLFDKVIPGLFDNLSDFETIANMIVAWCTSIGFCIAVVIFETGALILHGVMFEVRNTQ